MTLDECKPGRRLWWQRSQHNGTFFKPVRVVKRTARRVIVLVNFPYGPARRTVLPEYLFSKLPTLSSGSVYLGRPMR